MIVFPGMLLVFFAVESRESVKKFLVGGRR